MKPKLWLLLAVLTLAMLLGTSRADAEKRVALVIGIANYETLPDLQNTINDHDLIRETLEDLDFEVTSLVNPHTDAFRDVVSDFKFQAEIADVALVYYAGHGVEVGGKNFLVSAESRAKSRADVVRTSVSLDEVLAAVDQARQMRIVVLDSCRNDPFQASDQREIVAVARAARSADGLAPPSPERGTLVAFAAKHGEVAIDGFGKNSPFALALAANLKTPNLEIGLMFRRVRDDVLRSTANLQEPHTYGSLSGKPFFFTGKNQGANQLKNAERNNAWSKLDIDQEQQLQLLAEGGDPRALKGLAYMRLDPNESRYDPAIAVELLKRASMLEDPEAKFELGRLYEKGMGVDQNVERAIELFHESADAGFPDALNDLGFLYFQGGLGIVRDQRTAIHYFERAAELRHPEAMFNFAALIDDGIVEGKTNVHAAELLYNALRRGGEDVLAALTENPQMFKPQTRSALQVKLSERGFYQGKIDGQFGPQTNRGLRRAFGLVEN